MYTFLTISYEMQNIRQLSRYIGKSYEILAKFMLAIQDANPKQQWYGRKIWLGKKY